jgi:hypothetical protein
MVRYLEQSPGKLKNIGHAIKNRKTATLRTTLVKLGLGSFAMEFIEENGGGPGVRLRKRQQKKG